MIAQLALIAVTAVTGSTRGGDCGFDKYAVAESGASGYCYGTQAPSTAVVVNDVEVSPSTPALTVAPVVVSKPPCNTGCNKVDDGSVAWVNPKGSDPESDKTPVEQEPCITPAPVTPKP